MTCELCRIESSVQYYPDVSGLLRQLCEACRSMEALRIADGSHNGARRVPTLPANENSARLVETAQARAERAVELLAMMVRAFPELRTSLSSEPQQAVLREVRALLAEEGR